MVQEFLLLSLIDLMISQLSTRQNGPSHLICVVHNLMVDNHVVYGDTADINCTIAASKVTSHG